MAGYKFLCGDKGRKHIESFIIKDLNEAAESEKNKSAAKNTNAAAKKAEQPAKANTGANTKAAVKPAYNNADVAKVEAAADEAEKYLHIAKNASAASTAKSYTDDAKNAALKAAQAAAEVKAKYRDDNILISAEAEAARAQRAADNAAAAVVNAEKAAEEYRLRTNTPAYGSTPAAVPKPSYTPPQPTYTPKYNYTAGNTDDESWDFIMAVIGTVIVIGCILLIVAFPEYTGTIIITGIVVLAVFEGIIYFLLKD